MATKRERYLVRCQYGEIGTGYWQENIFDWKEPLVGDWPAAPVVSRPPLNRATGKLIMMQVANEPAHERLPRVELDYYPTPPERPAQGKAAGAALR